MGDTANLFRVRWQERESDQEGYWRGRVKGRADALAGTMWLVAMLLQTIHKGVPDLCSGEGEGGMQADGVELRIAITAMLALYDRIEPLLKHASQLEADWGWPRPLRGNPAAAKEYKNTTLFNRLQNTSGRRYTSEIEARSMWW